MKRLLLLALLIALPASAQDISASYSDSNFEEIFHVDTLQSIEMWEQPKTQYTPKNLVSEQQMRFNGKEGARTYNSYTMHFTDYDTKITESYFKDGKFYIKDNTGRVFQTGALQEVDTSGLETAIQNNSQNIEGIKNNVSTLDTRVNKLQSQVNKLDNKLEQGLATVTALTALHPNPRYKGKTQISIGAGMYADNVAGAIGVFHYLNDKVMLSAGASYGGNSSFAGNVGITIGF